MGCGGGDAAGCVLEEMLQWDVLEEMLRWDLLEEMLWWDVVVELLVLLWWWR